MQKKVFQHILTWFFIITFLIPRVVNLHVFSHLSDDDSLISCELCDTVAQYDQFDLMIGDSYSLVDQQLHIPSVLVLLRTYDSPLEQIVSPLFNFNKPPPFVHINMDTFHSVRFV